MSVPRETARDGRCCSCLSAGARTAAEEYSFDASEFEKKPFELGGYVQLKQEDFALNRDGAFYKLGFYNQPQRESLDRTTGTLELVGQAAPRASAPSISARTPSLQRDQLAHDHDNRMFEAAYSIRPDARPHHGSGKAGAQMGQGLRLEPDRLRRAAQGPERSRARARRSA